MGLIQSIIQNKYMLIQHLKKICIMRPDLNASRIIIIFQIRIGSTIVEHEVITNKTEEANQGLVEAVFSLSDGVSKIKYKNEILTTSSVAVSDASGKLQGT